MFYFLLVLLFGIFVGLVVGIAGLVVKDNRIAMYGFLASPVCMALALFVVVLGAAIELRLV